ncbi:hypothetical protein NQ314_009084 [Rhamnusium bicolor]|uniref:Peptidase S1 domain-containing protein n=1 Tax=Rhamnusium bicolor TaxID=1586634 RepID=A0AAV8Y498_9CUCU|nr:hypothetical protein NQ314_009084 [Rhamnusium bicolor]
MKAAPNGRIVGGFDANRGQFPYICSLQLGVLSVRSHSCGCSLLTPTWIVTAAHCFTEAPSIASHYVLLGVLYLNDTNVERQEIRIGSYYLHEDYEGGVNPHDVAVARLSTPAILSDYVQVIPLPEPGEYFAGTTVLSGWGSTECDAALTSILGGSDHPLDFEANICTGPLIGGISACSGDSGGPLVKYGVLIGIVSWGITPCGSVGAPSVYTRVSNYVDWIHAHIDAH